MKKITSAFRFVFLLVIIGVGIGLILGEENNSDFMALLLETLLHKIIGVLMVVYGVFLFLTWKDTDPLFYKISKSATE